MPKRFGARILAPFGMFAVERINPINRDSSAPPRGRVGILLEEKGRHWRPREIRNPRDYLAKSPGIRLPAPTFIHGQRLKLIHDSRAHLHQPMAMPQQLS
jgi:hypothetical protein